MLDFSREELEIVELALNMLIENRNDHITLRMITEPMADIREEKETIMHCENAIEKVRKM